MKLKSIKKTTLLCAVFLAVAASAEASLIFKTAVVISGTGLGAVNTLVTVHDPGGPGDNDGTEGGCISRVAGADSETCAPGTTITEQDNTAINQTVLFSNLLFGAGDQLGAVVNIAETGQDLSVTLTDLYLSFYDVDGGLIHVAQYEGPDKVLTQGTGTGLGLSGFVFQLDAAQSAFVLLGNPVTVGGGVQFLEGTTDDGNDTVHVIAFEGPPIPEPSTLMLFGGTLLGIGIWRRKVQKALRTGQGTYPL